MQNRFFPSLKVRDICILGLLMAITTLLSVFCTFRLGTVVKIPLKFISVFLTAILYGPVYGGLVAAVGDIMNCILAPSGPIIPQITVIEFISGFTFGLFFLKKNLSRTDYAVRVILCAFCQLFIDMVITTTVFSLWLGWYATFTAGFIIRVPAGVIKLILHIIVPITLYPLTITLSRLKSKEATH
ncbi:MAG: folate family ECF transporter S component [Ruminococcaceae bacterium]|nr:folate family ECF transporter S component [Oscillospiraceae bacterium]